MRIVIDISEEKYDVIKSDLYNTFSAEMKEWGLEAIRKGTPLPKGHGDLIDRNSILCDDCSCEQCGHTLECFKLLAQTIIEADGGDVE